MGTFLSHNESEKVGKNETLSVSRVNCVNCVYFVLSRSSPHVYTCKLVTQSCESEYFFHSYPWTHLGTRTGEDHCWFSSLTLSIDSSTLDWPPTSHQSHLTWQYLTCVLLILYETNLMENSLSFFKSKDYHCSNYNKTIVNSTEMLLIFSHRSILPRRMKIDQIFGF